MDSEKPTLKPRKRKSAVRTRGRKENPVADILGAVKAVAEVGLQAYNALLPHAKKMAKRLKKKK
jgi:hypothetical protein